MNKGEITSLAPSNDIETRANQLNPYEEQPKEAAIEAAIMERANELAEKGIPIAISSICMPKSMMPSLDKIPEPWRFPQIRRAEIRLEVFINPENAQGKDPPHFFEIDENGLHTEGYKFEDGEWSDTEMVTFEWPTTGPKTLLFGRNAKECDLGIGLNPNLSRQHFKITLNPDHTIELPTVLTTNGSFIQVKGEAVGLKAAQDAIKAAVSGEPSIYNLN